MAGSPPLAPQPSLRDALQRALEWPTAVSLTAGAAIQQTRTLYAMECAAEVGAGKQEEARQQLARAASLGSFLEFVLGPLLGRLSDQVGRRPVFLFYAGMPTITRFLSALPWPAATRLRCLYTDVCLLRACGVQAMRSMAQTMISDAAGVQMTQLRSSYQKFFALGIVLGSLSGGKLTARAGPKATYLAASLLGMLTWLRLAAKVPETHLANQTAEAKGGSAKSSAEVWRALCTLLADREARYITAALSLHPFAELAQINDVHVLFMRDTLKKGAGEIGLFASLYGMAQFFGHAATSWLVDQFGPTTQVSLSHACVGLAFLLWGTARSSLGMFAVLPILAGGIGRDTELTNRLIQRAAALDVGRGMAHGALSAAQALAKTSAPLVFMWLHNRSVARDKLGRRPAWRLPPGAPMLFVALLAVVTELLHRVSLRARREQENFVAA